MENEPNYRLTFKILDWDDWVRKYEFYAEKDEEAREKYKKVIKTENDLRHGIRPYIPLKLEKIAYESVRIERTSSIKLE